MANVNRKLICETDGQLVTYMSDHEVPLADLYEGMAIALRRRDAFDKAIENMRDLIREEESHGNE